MGIEIGKPVYLGDSVYVEYDGFHIVLYLNNGFGPKGQIYLDDEVASSLLKYLEKAFEEPSK